MSDTEKRVWFDVDRPELPSELREYCAVKTTAGGYQCAKRAGHDGFHETTGGYQWLRTLDTDPLDYPRCGSVHKLRGYVCTLGRRHSGLHTDADGHLWVSGGDPIKRDGTWAIRERWKFTGRYVTPRPHIEYYTWECVESGRGSLVGAVWASPVATLLGGKR